MNDNDEINDQQKERKNFSLTLSNLYRKEHKDREVEQHDYTVPL